MKKKQDKVIILLIAMLVYTVLSWIIESGGFTSGQFASIGLTQIGLFDIFLVVYSSFLRVLPDIMYLLIIGGCYGVLSQTNGYRKLVDKTSKLIKGKEAIVLAVITLVIGAYTSISSQLLVLLCVSPFIVTVFLRNGYDRLTALSAGFGGLFVGILGLTFGTYGLSYLNSTLSLNVNDWIVTKAVIFVIAYVLYIVFAILHMNKNKKVDETKYDMFSTEELDETKIKKRNKTKVWPTVLVSVLCILVLAIGYIDWTGSFGVKIFSELYTSFAGGFEIADVPVFSTIVGSYMKAFGEWGDLLYGGFVILIAIFVIVLINKVNFETMLRNFGLGMRKYSRVALIYGLAMSIAYLSVLSAWPTTVINTLFGSGSFNIFTILLLAFIAQIILVDPDCFTQTFSGYLAVAFADNVVATGLLWRLGSAIAFVVGPTSFLLLSVLTYLDIPYKDWLKYIWKFMLSFVLVILIVLALIIYV